MNKCRKCPICGQKFTSRVKHYNDTHSDITYSEYLSKLLELLEVPKCPYCGEECSVRVNGNSFNATCNKPECKHKHRSDFGKEVWKRESYQDRMSESQVKAWSNPEIHERRRCGIQRAQSQEEYRELKRDISKRTHSTPEVKKKLSEASKKNWSNPVIRLKKLTSQSKAFSNLKSNNALNFTLYLVKFCDVNSGNFCVKCGVSGNLRGRLDQLKAMNYKFIIGYKYEGISGDLKKIEKSVHHNNFLKYEMDRRFDGILSNGYTEWYQPTELYKIKLFIESQGYALTEIKL